MAKKIDYFKQNALSRLKDSAKTDYSTNPMSAHILYAIERYDRVSPVSYCDKPYSFRSSLPAITFIEEKAYSTHPAHIREFNHFFHFNPSYFKQAMQLLPIILVFREEDYLTSELCQFVKDFFNNLDPRFAYTALYLHQKIVDLYYEQYKAVLPVRAIKRVIEKEIKDWYCPKLPTMNNRRAYVHENAPSTYKNNIISL